MVRIGGERDVVRGENIENRRQFTLDRHGLISVGLIPK